MGDMGVDGGEGGPRALENLFEYSKKLKGAASGRKTSSDREHTLECPSEAQSPTLGHLGGCVSPSPFRPHCVELWASQGH